jgi:hypothetical protein
MLTNFGIQRTPSAVFKLTTNLALDKGSDFNAQKWQQAVHLIRSTKFHLTTETPIS